MPTSTINWPETLACTILQDGFELSPVSQLLRTDLKSGRAFQRRKYLSSPMNASIKFLFDEAQYLFFEGFFIHVLNAGVNWFNIQLKTSTGIDNYLCRFTDDYDSASVTGGRFWKVSADIELYLRPVIGSDWVTITPDFVANISIFDLAMTREWPRG